jgi:hypothetical protein
MLTLTNDAATRAGRVDAVREQLLAGAGVAEQQHGRIGAGDTACLALDLERRRTGADEAGDRVLGPALRGELSLHVFELALQARELGHQRLHRRLGLVHQHQADRADHHARFVAQRQAAHQEGACLVGQQIHQDRPPGLDHLVHQRVGHHFFDAFADEIALARKPQRRQETFVAFADPDDSVLAVDHHHAHRGLREEVEHRLRGQLQHAVGALRQHVFAGHCGQL